MAEVLDVLNGLRQVLRVCPALNRMEAYRKLAPEALRTVCRSDQDHFIQRRRIRLDGGARTLVVDWGCAEDDVGLLRWE